MLPEDNIHKKKAKGAIHSTLCPSFLNRNRSLPHTRGRCDGRQEGCEGGYYNLHRYLNNSVRLHNSSFSQFLKTSFSHFLNFSI
jgi:hypothetical protein